MKQRKDKKVSSNPGERAFEVIALQWWEQQKES